MSVFNKSQQKIAVLLRQVTATKEALHVGDPSTGISILPDCDAYGRLALSIRHKTPIFWRAGRAGFSYTDAPKAPYSNGVWIFPSLHEALLGRERVIAEGFTIKTVSWEELPEKT